MEKRNGQITTVDSTGLEKLAVPFSADTFMMNQTLALRIKYSGIHRRLF